MAISSFGLLNFRNHVNLQFENLSHSNNFVVGPNGSGKTNILEAISLLSPGKGLRSAKGVDIFTSHGSEIYPNWAAHFQILDTSYNISFAMNNGRESKIIKRDETLIRSGRKMLEQIKVVWLTPQMCHLFVQGADERRKFFDRIVYNHIPTHADSIITYKKLMRSRMHLLKQPSYDPNWVTTLEEQMAQQALKIIANRCKVLDQIKAKLQAYDWNWQPHLKLELSYNLQENGDEVKTYAKHLAQNRKRDAVIGRTNLGPHKDDLLFTHSIKHMDGRFCSTGEQKNAVIKIMLAHLASLQDEAEMPIILLLDDIFAHIDDYNKDMILTALKNAKSVQKWITATPDDLNFVNNNFHDIKIIEL